MDYSIVSVFASLEEFQKECQKKINDGFTPIGGISVISYQGFQPQFIQAFVRNEVSTQGYSYDPPTVDKMPILHSIKCDVTTVEGNPTPKDNKLWPDIYNPNVQLTEDIPVATPLESTEKVWTEPPKKRGRAKKTIL